MYWHENIHNDPYEQYRDQPGGCRDILIAIAIFIALCLFTVFCVGCKTQNIPTNTRDSVRVEFKHDSVYVFKHDSIFRDRWRSGDTVYITTEKWQTLFRDKLIEVHDTISTTDVQYVKEAYVPTYYKNTSKGFWVLMAALIAFVGYKAVRWYLKVKSGSII